jgi:hypothetical protein
VNTTTVTTGPARVDIVFIGLAVATFIAVLLNSGAAHDLFTPHGAAAIAAAIAFAKARFVVSEFMGLRGTALQWLFDAWIVVVGAMSIALLLR